MSDTRTDKLEETVAHLTRIVEDLSEIVARQEREIDYLKRRVGLLLEREASREVDAGGTIPLADQKPPHW
jgi:SlyX protein